jgi:hypothetical protein
MIGGGATAAAKSGKYQDTVMASAMAPSSALHLPPGCECGSYKPQHMVWVEWHTSGYVAD